MGPPERSLPDPKHPRAVAEGAARCLDCDTPPSEGFVDGVEAERRRRQMDPAYGAAYGLGEYTPPPPDPNRPVELGGAAAAIRFPTFWHAWFAKQNQRTLRILDKIIDWLDRHGEEEAEKRLDDLDEMIERHRARRRLVVRAKWVGKYGGPAAAAAYGFATLAADKAGRFIEQMPVLRAVWKAIMGPT